MENELRRSECPKLKFANNRNLGMVAPLGAVFGPDTPAESIFSGITEWYGMQSGAPAFDTMTRQKLAELHKQVTGVELDVTTDLLIAAGTMFWARPLDLEVGARGQPLQ